MVSSYARLQRGFGMIEIVIYISILALLAGVVGPKLFQIFASSQKKTTRMALKNVADQINVYHIHTGRYPETLEDLSRKPSDERVASRWDGPYLELKEGELPRDGWGNDIQYNKNDSGFELYSFGPNCENGSDEERVFVE